ncbi:MAG: V-type ATPase subunit [Clostridia bacterium]|nr:V-type ATPase subunit [Clostridia bacterium]
MKNQYIYAATRLHAMEDSMLSRQNIERIFTSSTIDDALSVLSQKGYDCTSLTTVEELIDREQEKTLKLVSSLVEDMSVFDVLFYTGDFQNLKAAVKSIANEDYLAGLFVAGGTIPPEVIAQAVEKRKFDILPKFLRDTAKNARKLFLETGDGALCDRMIDRACLDTILERGKQSDCKMIRDYAELTVALGDIKIALRGARLGKKIEFFKQSLANCDSISVSLLEKAAANGEKDVLEYLKLTDYGESGEAWKEGYEVFEKWCDDKVMEKVKEHRFNYFTLAPIAAYILAKNTEFKTVRIAVTALQNQIDAKKVRERLRELYV